MRIPDRGGTRRDITTEQAIQQLQSREEDGDAAVVQVVAGGAERTFLLRRTNHAERS